MHVLSLVARVGRRDPSCGNNLPAPHVQYSLSPLLILAAILYLCQVLTDMRYVVLSITCITDGTAAGSQV